MDIEYIYFLLYLAYLERLLFLVFCLILGFYYIFASLQFMNEYKNTQRMPLSVYYLHFFDTNK